MAREAIMPVMRVIGGALVKWLGAGTLAAILLGGAGYLYHDWQTGRMQSQIQAVEAELERLRVNRDGWRTAAESWEARAERLTAERDAAQAAQKTLQGRLREQAAAYDDLRQQIRQAPEADDAPVAPVLRGALEALP